MIKEVSDLAFDKTAKFVFTDGFWHAKRNLKVNHSKTRKIILSCK